MKFGGWGLSTIEICFALGALVLTLVAGLVLWPALRSALRDPDDPPKLASPRVDAAKEGE